MVSQTPNEWQILDKELGIIKPWYTASFLNVLDAFDLSDKVIWEYGIGASTIWYAHKAKILYGVDSNETWLKDVNESLEYYGKKDKATFSFTDKIDKYSNAIYLPNIKFDVVVVDGMERDYCIEPALDCVKKGGVIILDNWLQHEVWMPTEKTQELLNKYPNQIYKQEGHPYWKTAIFYINE